MLTPRAVGILGTRMLHSATHEYRFGAALLVALAIGLTSLITRPSVTEGHAVSFMTSLETPYGIQSTSLDAGDFNHDGLDDIAVLDGSVVVLLLSRGDGTFFPPSVQRSGGKVGQQLLARDFNGDGNLDVVACYADGDVWLFLGDGRGALSAGERFSVGGATTSLAAADFDHDGDLDIVVALAGGSVTGRAQLILNDGHGAFVLSGSAMPIGRAPQRIAAGDFDGDGNVDIAATNVFDRTATVLFGTPSLTFGDSLVLRTGEPSPATPLPFGLAAGDIDADGLDDIVVANGLLDTSRGTPPGGSVATATDNPSGLQDNPIVPFGNAAVFFSSGQRRFASPVLLAADNYPHDVRIVDVDGDKRLDVVAGGGGGVLTFTADGRGGFVRRGTTVGSTFGQSLTVGDFNGDRRPDFGTVGSTSRIDIYLGRPGGDLDRPRYLIATSTQVGADFLQPSQVIAADVDANSVADLVTATGLESNIVTFVGTGDGDFGPPVVSHVAGAVGFLAAADFTGDGYVDLAISRFEGGRDVLELLRGDGHGHFALEQRISDQADYGKLEVADLDGDHIPDLVAVARRPDGTIGADVFIGTQGHLQLSSQLFARGATVDLKIADANSDGNPDVLLLNSADPLSLFLGIGQRHFAEEIQIRPPTDGGVAGAALGDLDEDGIPDLVISQVRGSQRITDPIGTFWLKGDGRGHFGAPIHLTPEHVGLVTQGTFIGRVFLADFNRDTHLDIAVESNGLSVFAGVGGGRFLPPKIFAIHTSAAAPTVADINGDTLPDVIAAAESLGADGLPSIKLGVLFNTSATGEVAPGDTNCDGVVDGRDQLTLITRIFHPFYQLACRGADVNRDAAVSAADLSALVQ